MQLLQMIWNGNPKEDAFTVEAHRILTFKPSILLKQVIN